MIVNFATCDRNKALGYIQKVYPSKTITDTPDCAGPLLDFVGKDMVRIQDPMMYGSSIQVTPGNNWVEDDAVRNEIVAACRLFAQEVSMTRHFKLKDYGEDYGYGRYQVTIDNGRMDEETVNKGITNPQDVLKLVYEFLKEGPSED